MFKKKMFMKTRYKKTVYKKTILLVITMMVMPLKAAQLRVITPEREPTNLVIIKESNSKAEGELKGLKLKKRIEKELGLTLKVQANLTRKDTKRFIADRNITPQEQESFLNGLSSEQKESVIFVPEVNKSSSKRKKRSLMRSNNTKSVK